MATTAAPGLPEIELARERLQGVARVTPVFPSETLSRLAGRQVRLKAENLQRTGSFKIRGAYVKLASVAPERRAEGVVAASAGNHGQAVAWAARELGAPARIFMPQDSPMAKVDATRHYGADVELTGPAIEEALEAARAYAEATGAVFVHPFEDPLVIAGQGTIGLELAEQVADLATVVIPVGGGGLAAGVSLALRALRPGLRIVGVRAAGTMPGGSGYTIADGIAVKHPGSGTSAILDETLDDLVARADEARRRRSGRGRGSRDPGRSRRRLRPPARAPLRRQHRRLAHGAGDAARPRPARPLPGRAHPRPRPPRGARPPARPAGRRAGQRGRGRAPARGGWRPGRPHGRRADAPDPRPRPLRRAGRADGRLGLSGRATRLTSRRARPGPPAGHSALEHRPRLDAGGPQDARGDRRPGAGFADRDHRSSLEEPGLGCRAHGAIGEVARAGDVLLVVLRALPHVEQLDLAAGEQSLELLERDRLEAVVASGLLPAGDVEHADRVQRPRRVQRLRLGGRMEDDRAGRQDERRLGREGRPRDRDADRPCAVTGGERLARPHVEDGRLPRRRLEPPQRRLRAKQGTPVQLDDPLEVRRPRRLRSEGGGQEVREVPLQRWVEAALEADRRRGLRAHRRSAEGACDVAGEDLDPVAQRDEPSQAVVERLASLARLDGEVGPRGVADEQGVPGQDEPRLAAAGAVADGEAAVLRPVAGRVQGTDDHVAEHELAAVLERLVGERDAGGGVDPDREAVLEGEPAVTGDVVGVRVRLEHGDQPDPLPGRRLEERLDVVRGVDRDRDAGSLIADEVRRAAQIAVQELLEQHAATLAGRCATPLEAVSPGLRSARRRRAPLPAAAR